MNAPAPAVVLGPRRTSFKRVLLWFLLFGLALALAYWAGYWPSTQRIAGLERDLAAERARSETLERRVVALEARRSLHAALLEVGRENYGLARERLALAGELLKEPAAANPGLRSLVDSIAQLQIDPAQRAQANDAIVKLIVEFDAADPQPPQGQQPAPAPQLGAAGAAP